MPYKVKQMKYSDFMKLSGSFFVSIRPGKKAGDPTVHDLHRMKYESNGAIQCKVSFTEDWVDLPQRIQMVKDLRWVPLFSEALPITASKFKDLQSMKHVMPHPRATIFTIHCLINKRTEVKLNCRDQLEPRVGTLFCSCNILSIKKQFIVISDRT